MKTTRDVVLEIAHHDPTVHAYISNFRDRLPWTEVMERLVVELSSQNMELRGRMGRLLERTAYPMMVFLKGEGVSPIPDEHSQQVAHLLKTLMADGRLSVVDLELTLGQTVGRVPSESQEGKEWEIREWNGSLACTCPDYRFRKGPAGKKCKHIRHYMGDGRPGEGWGHSHGRPGG